MFDNSPRTIAQVQSTLSVSSSAAIVAAAVDQQRKDAKHREIARHYDQQRRKKRSRPSTVSLTIGDLEKFFDDKYGLAFPDDDAGRDDLVVLLHYVAQLGDPSAMRRSVAHRCPRLTGGEYTAMIAAIERKLLRWGADSLAAEIGLNRATRSCLGITTIGATDFCKAKRTARRKKAITPTSAPVV